MTSFRRPATPFNDSINSSDSSERNKGLNMRRFWHSLFGHGKSYIEEHCFRMGQESAGILYLCHGCNAKWFEWSSLWATDLLTDMAASSHGLLKYLGNDQQPQQQR